MLTRLEVIDYADKYIKIISTIWDATYAKPFTKEQLAIAQRGMKAFKEELATDCETLRKFEKAGKLSNEGMHLLSELKKVKANMQVAWNANPHSDKNNWSGELYSAKSDFILIRGQYERERSL
jgi:hypothetical protein